MRKRIVLRVAVIVTTACLGLGCSGGDDSAEDDESMSGAFDEIEGMEIASGQVPISPEDRGAIGLAQSRLVAACMAREGFDYSANVEFEVRYHLNEAPLYLSPEELRRSGYQYDWQAAGESFLARNTPEDQPSPTDGMSAEEAEAYSLAEFGDPDDMLEVTMRDGSVIGTPRSGCIAEARLELYGTLENHVRFDNAFQGLSGGGVSSELQRDDDYASAAADWRACMVEAGFAVGDQLDYGFGYIQQQGAAALSNDGADQTVMTADVIQAVVDADADCQESTGLHELRAELLPKAEEAIADRLGFEMSQYIAFQHAVLERAEQVP